MPLLSSLLDLGLHLEQLELGMEPGLDLEMKLLGVLP